MRPPSAMPESVVSPGNHDGVHLGHRALLTRARALAAPHGWQTVAMFFDPHPTAMLSPERAPKLLTTPARRAEILREAGVDRVVMMPFTPAFASLSPRAFVERVLIEECNARAVVVGPDFQFGHKRSGTIDTLRALGDEYGFEVSVVPPVVHGETASSSTRIRACLAEGAIDDVTAMLTRLHEVDGTVVHGDARGRTLSFPTANLEVDDVCLPKDGVYAVVVRRLGAPAKLHHGVLNLGGRPTVARGRSFEVHLFDFDDDVYGERLRVGFVARLRDVQRFASLEALTAQITEDCAHARAALSRRRTEEPRWLSTAGSAPSSTSPAR